MGGGTAGGEARFPPNPPCSLRELPILAMIGKFWGLTPFLKGLWNKNSPLLRHIIAKYLINIFIPSLIYQ